MVSQRCPRPVAQAGRDKGVAPPTIGLPSGGTYFRTHAAPSHHPPMRMVDRSRGANGGSNGGVAGRRRPTLASPNSLKRQRPPLACAGRVRLRIGSSTTGLLRRDSTAAAYGAGRDVYGVVPKLPAAGPSSRPTNLASCRSTRCSTTAAQVEDKQPVVYLPIAFE